MKNTYAVLVCFITTSLLLTTPANAWNYWERHFGGAYNDDGRDLIVTPTGEYVITGITYSYGSGAPTSSNGNLLKVNSSGDLIWQSCWGQECYDDWYNTLISNSDGSYYTTYGYTEHGWMITNWDEFLWGNFNISGESCGQLSWGTPEYDEIHACDTTSDHNVVVAGRQGVVGYPTNEYAYVSKLNHWTTLYLQGVGIKNAFYDVKQSNDGGCIAVGYRSDPDPGTKNWFAAKLNNNGYTQWCRYYMNNQGTAYTVTKTADGGDWLVAGDAGAVNSGYIRKISHLNGDVIWERSYYTELGAQTIMASDNARNGYIITGKATQGNGDVFLAKLTYSGDVIWVQYFGGPQNDVPMALNNITNPASRAETFLITGYTYSFGNGSDVYLIKCWTDGSSPQNTNSYYEEQPTLANSITPTSNGYLVPNVIRNKINIDYDLDKMGFVDITIYDIAGKKIICLHDNQCAGRHNQSINVSSLNSGVYFLVIQSPGYNYTHKFTLIK